VPVALVALSAIPLTAGTLRLIQLASAPAPVEPSGLPVTAAGEPVVEVTGSLILWQALAGIYESLGFTEIDDDAFRALMLGRIIEPLTGMALNLLRSAGSATIRPHARHHRSRHHWTRSVVLENERLEECYEPSPAVER
jgi:hypothetical protein